MGLMCAYSMLFKVSSMCLAIYLVHTSTDSVSLCLTHLLNMPHAFITKCEQVCVSYFIQEISITFNTYLFVKNS